MQLIYFLNIFRLELISFDKSRQEGQVTGAEGGSMVTPQLERKLSVGGMKQGSVSVRCYGCASACVEHCLTLLRAIATRKLARPELHNQVNIL